MNQSMTTDVAIPSHLQKGCYLWQSNWTNCLLMIASMPWMCRLTSVMRKVAAVINCTKCRLSHSPVLKLEWHLANQLQKSGMPCSRIVSIDANLRRIWRLGGTILSAFRVGWQFAMGEGTMRFVKTSVRINIMNDGRLQIPIYEIFIM